MRANSIGFKPMRIKTVISCDRSSHWRVQKLVFLGGMIGQELKYFATSAIGLEKLLRDLQIINEVI